VPVLIGTFDLWLLTVFSSPVAGFPAAESSVLHRLETKLFRYPIAFIGVIFWTLPAAVLADPVSVPQITNAATLEGAAFAQAIGLVRVNVAAGVGNEQINTATIGLGRTASDAALAGATTTQRIGPIGVVNVGARNRVSVTPGAFAHASGLVQVNQTAGNGNASTNAFTLNLHP